MVTILFVGSNPSNASASNSAFHGSTRSAQILAQWTKDIDQSSVKTYTNVLDVKTDKNRPLKTDEIKANLARLNKDIESADRVVALGKTAAKALGMLGIAFYEMPHPSPRNRANNDKVKLTRMIQSMHEYLNRNNLCVSQNTLDISMGTDRK